MPPRPLHHVSFWSAIFIASIVGGAHASGQDAQARPPVAGMSVAALRGWADARRQVADTQSLDRVVSLNLSNVTVGQALQQLSKVADVRLVYSNRVVPVDRRVSIHVSGVTVARALHMILAGLGVDVKSVDGEVMLVKAGVEEPVPGQGGAVWGRVRDSSTTRALAGASVTVDALPLHAVTNDSGSYYIPNVPAGMHRLTVRMIGYVAAHHVFVIPDAAVDTVTSHRIVRVDVHLHMFLTQLGEIVSTATGETRRLDLGNAIAVINADSIAKAAPVLQFTDLLATRVSGLTSLTASGNPGDPVRMLLRGASSPSLSNDPIVIIDGVRMYASQSDCRNMNIAASGSLPLSQRPCVAQGATPTAGLLDQIDPNSIQSIEVFKGPSAATLYGADAANGVIVVTTKRGRVGPPRWTASMQEGVSYVPGKYPEATYRVGHPFQSSTMVGCQLIDFTCVADSVIHFQLLNDPSTTPLRDGQITDASAGVSGGQQALTYYVSARSFDNLGVLGLPRAEASRFRALHGINPPEWMSHPMNYSGWQANANVDAHLSSSADLQVFARLSSDNQTRSSLESQLGTLMGTYYDPLARQYFTATNGVVVGSPDLVQGFYTQESAARTEFQTGATGTWRPRDWLVNNATLGIDFQHADDQSYLAQGLDPVDTGGQFNIGQQETATTTLQWTSTATIPMPLGFTLMSTGGLNFTGEHIADLGGYGTNILPGTSSLDQAATTRSEESRSDPASYGWMIDNELSSGVFTLSGGVRIDGGNTYGSHVHFSGLPKLGGSWLISEEPYFPGPFKRVFNTLRLRASFGQAQRLPGVGQRYRLYTKSAAWLDSAYVATTGITTLGNTHLRPERGVEVDGGFDADMLDDHLMIGMSWFRKRTRDALMDVQVPPSVIGNGPASTVTMNVGTTQNTGVEVDLTLTPIRRPTVTWGTTLNYTHYTNKLLALAPGVLPFYSAEYQDPSAGVTSGSRIAPGYPLFGIWARPIRGYADQNHDGIIEPSEVQLGDTAVYMGVPDPTYQVNGQTVLTLMRGALTLSANVQYRNGLTQTYEPQRFAQYFAAGANDPKASFAQQATIAALGQTDYGLIQTVSTLRLVSLTIGHVLSPSLAHRLGAQQLAVSVSGLNLGLLTNYHGKDPEVNGYGTDYSVIDTGQIPTPRTWEVKFNVTY